MKPRLFCAAVITASAAVVAAQTTTAPMSTSKKTDTKSISVTGCVCEDGRTPGNFTLTDFTTGPTTYRLTGTDIWRYRGKRVVATGTELPSKLTIGGGLVPSPNVAAQAGAMDPTRAAMAAQGSEGSTKPGSKEVPALRVRSVKPIAGDCERP